MTKFNSPEEIKSLFYSIYNNDKNNLKLVGEELLKKGLSHMEILMLTMSELNLSLFEAITLLHFPDYLG